MAIAFKQFAFLLQPLWIVLLIFQIQLPLLAQDGEPNYSTQIDNGSESLPTTTGTARDLETDLTAESPIQPALPAANQPENECLRSIEVPESLRAEEGELFIREIRVDSIRRNTVLANEIDQIREAYRGLILTPEVLSSLQDAITLCYIQNGYITSWAEVHPSSEEGSVMVEITEGQVQLQIEPIETPDFNFSSIEADAWHNTFRSHIEQQLSDAIAPPVNTIQLENALRLLESDSRFSKIEPVLSQSGTPGISLLTIRYQENEFGLNIDFNNYSPPSTGAERVDSNFRLNNAIRDGDQLVISTQFDPLNFSTVGGANFVGLGYRIPLDRDNTALQLRVETNQNAIIQDEFREFDLRASSELFEVSFRHALHRSYNEELGLSLGFSYQNGQTFVFNNRPQPFGIGPDENGVSRTSALTLGLDYLHRDSSGRWLSQAQCQFGLGIFDATDNPEPTPDGQFVSCLGQVQRVQRIGGRNFLIFQGDVQLTPNSLLPSQQFALGGGTSLRGYRENARSADNGIRFSVENRFTVDRNRDLQPVLQLAPFVDVGYVWNNADNPNRLPDQNFLGSVGLGVLWQPFPNLNLRVDYALPFVDVSDRGDNLQDNGLHFSVNYRL